MISNAHQKDKGTEMTVVTRLGEERRSNRWPTRVLEDNVSEAMCKETIAENFTNLMKATDSYIQEAQEIPSIDTKKSTNIHHKQTTEQ